MGGRAGPREVELISYAELLALPPAQTAWLVEGLIVEGSGTILGGVPNVGKSWLSLDLARAVASGTPWLGRFPTAQAPVLVIDEEGYLGGIQSRLEMLERGHPLGSDLPIRFAVGHGLRLDDDSVAEIDRAIQEHKPRLVILDSFTRFHGANENSAAEMAEVFGVARALIRHHGCALLFVDHVRKKGVNDDPDEMLRGSSEKRAWPDTILLVTPNEESSARFGMAVRHSKSRYGQRLDPFTVDCHVDEATGLAVLRPGEGTPTDSVTRGRDIVGAIHDVAEHFGRGAATVKEIAGLLGCSEDTVRRHIGKMVAAGLISSRKSAPGGRGRPSEEYAIVREDVAS